MNAQLNDADRRREQAYERLGTRTPKCQSCPETDPIVLTGKHPQSICYRCMAIRDGKKTTENHHIGGQHNDSFTVPIPANDHRRLNDTQNDWPERTLKNSDGSPLVGIAGLLRGWIDVLLLIIKQVLVKLPAALEDLNSCLTQSIGPAWWVTIGWQGVL